MEIPNWVIFGIIAALILLVLFGGVMPAISKQTRTFLSVTEPKELTSLKEACEKQQTDGCALEIAKITIEEDQNPLIAESWLKKEITFTNDEEILRQCFDFAKDTLIPLLKYDKESITTIYGMLKTKPISTAFKTDIEVAELTYTIKYTN